MESGVTIISQSNMLKKGQSNHYTRQMRLDFRLFEPYFIFVCIELYENNRNPHIFFLSKCMHEYMIIIIKFNLLITSNCFFFCFACFVLSYLNAVVFKLGMISSQEILVSMRSIANMHKTLLHEFSCLFLFDDLAHYRFISLFLHKHSFLLCFNPCLRIMGLS